MRGSGALSSKGFGALLRGISAVPRTKANPEEMPCFKINFKKIVSADIVCKLSSFLKQFVDLSC